MGGAVRKRRKALIEQLVRPGGEVLHFGWSSVGMGEGWTQEEILLVCHGSDHNDTICLAERRNAPHADLFATENAKVSSGDQPKSQYAKQNSRKR